MKNKVLGLVAGVVALFTVLGMFLNVFNFVTKVGSISHTENAGLFYDWSEVTKAYGLADKTFPEFFVTLFMILTVVAIIIAVIFAVLRVMELCGKKKSKCNQLNKIVNISLLLVGIILLLDAVLFCLLSKATVMGTVATVVPAVGAFFAVLCPIIAGVLALVNSKK